MTTTTLTFNGTTVPTITDAAAKRQRVAYLIRRIDGRLPLFGNVLGGLRHELGELCTLTGTDGSNVFARIDSLDADIKSLLYWCSDGKHDAHATPEQRAADKVDLENSAAAPKIDPTASTAP